MSYRYGLPVHILQQHIDSSHFAELLAEERLNPRGEWRADLRAGIQCSTMANMWRGKDSRVMAPIDYIPDFDKQPQTVEDQMAAAKAICAMFGGEV